MITTRLIKSTAFDYDDGESLDFEKPNIFCGVFLVEFALPSFRETPTELQSCLAVRRPKSVARKPVFIGKA